MKKQVIPRQIPEGFVPLVDIAGAARECGRRYAGIVQERYPGFTEYLDMAVYWQNLFPESEKLFSVRAPHIPEFYAGMLDEYKPASANSDLPEDSGCTSFSISPELTLDRFPVSGQNKDTACERAELYIVLRIRFDSAPSILVLAYPRGLCRHIIDASVDTCTTACIVAEQSRGLLHVCKGPPCLNWPSTYSIS